MREHLSRPISKLIYAIALTALLILLLGSAITNALISESQSQVNNLQEEYDDAIDQNRYLLSQEAKVKSADVVLPAAEERGMITASTVRYIPTSDSASEN